MSQFEILPEHILPHVKYLVGTVEASQVMQILAHVYVHIEHAAMTMTTSNTEMEVSVCIPIDVPKDLRLSFTVSAKKLTDILRIIEPSHKMSWTVEAQWITIKTDSIQYKLASLEADRFPFLPVRELPEPLYLPALLLKKLIDQTAFGIAKQDIRIYLTGLLLDITPGQITAVASDSYRMCLRTAHFEHSEYYTMQAIFPKKTVLELAKLLGSVPEDARVAVAFSDNIVTVAYNEWVLKSHLIDAHFPPYRKIIIKEAKGDIVLSVASLRSALTHIGICVNDRFRGADMVFKDNTLVLKSNNLELEEATEVIPIDYQGPELALSVSLGYFSDIISAVGSETIILKVNHDNKSIFIIPDNDPSALYMMMSFTL